MHHHCSYDCLVSERSDKEIRDRNDDGWLYSEVNWEDHTISLTVKTNY